MYLTIKAYSFNALKEFHNLYSNNNFSENIILDQIMIDNVQITFYKNLSILFKGNLSERIINDINILIDKELYVGSDEVGVGEGVGPMIAAAIKFPDFESKKRAILSGIKDSKKMSYEEIEKVAKIIEKEASGKIKILTPEKFNSLYKKYPNVKMINAFMQNELLSGFDDYSTRVTDQFVNFKKFNEYLEKLRVKRFKQKFIFETKAEEKYVEVAAAAIVAKHYYNKWIIDFCKNNNIFLEVNKKVKAQDLYLKIKSGEIKISKEIESKLVKDWSK